MAKKATAADNLIEVYANEKDCLKAIDSSAITTTNLGNRIQGIAVSCVLFAADSGNTNAAAYMINKLATADPKKSALNRPALIKWLGVHGITIRFDKTTKLFKAKINPETIAKVREGVTANRNAATTAMLNHHFTNMDSTASQFSGFDVVARLHSLIEQAKKVKADPIKGTHAKNNFTGLSKLELIAAEFPKQSKLA